tara:strand:+ start:10136 stop:11272 length:1137 start_codon:yes stop_codon:yes gene_type:complete
MFVSLLMREKEIRISLPCGAHFSEDWVRIVVNKCYPNSPLRVAHALTNPTAFFANNLCIKDFKGMRYKVQSGPERGETKQITYTLGEKDTIPVIFFCGEWYGTRVNSGVNNKYLNISCFEEDHDNVAEKDKHDLRLFFGAIFFTRYLHHDLHEYYRYNKNADNPVFEQSKKDNKYYPVSVQSRKDKKYFLGYCATRKTVLRTKAMNYFIDKYENTDEICCFGKDNNYRCKIAPLANYGVRIKHNGANILLSADYNWDLLKEYNKCKFVLNFENHQKAGYLTEKIVSALLAGSIPIYWGDSDLAKKTFNPKAFICVDDYDSIEQCIDYVISMTDDDINKMLEEPMFVNNKIPDIMDYRNTEPGTFYSKFYDKLKQLLKQ